MARVVLLDCGYKFPVGDTFVVVIDLDWLEVGSVKIVTHILRKLILTPRPLQIYCAALARLLTDWKVKRYLDRCLAKQASVWGFAVPAFG
jgi:hypothetical protein